MKPIRKVIVIGAGPAGYVCAIRLAQLGQEVTVVERDKLGGTCLNIGCVPSKALIAAGTLMEKVGRASIMGITCSDLALDVSKLVAWKSGIVDRLTGGIGTLLKNNGVNVVMGEARLASSTSVCVQTESGEQTLQADDIVLATGSVPTAIPGFDFDEDAVWSSTGALAPERIPKHLVVIGGGYIGLELGIMYHHLGSKVTVIEATKGALPGQERDCIKVIERSLKKRKIKLMTETFAKGWERTADGLSVTVEGKTGISTVECDQILSTVGRRPYSEGLGLESAGLSVNEQGFLDTDRQMRTSVPNIYAIGDIAGQPMLAHKGSKEGVVAAAVIAGQPEEYDAKCVPAVVFTAPEMASVGLTEEQCKEQGLDYAIGSFPFAASGRAMTLMETEGLVKVIADAKTDELLGVHMVGPEVTELIAEATLALEMGATAEDIARTIHAHPTLPEAFMEASEAVHGMAVHIYQRS
ncbi:dihydrolipoyl dehydrogenase [Candidatus Woesearchaeota archaeon]|jgi:dihydrolipoamide dehydrogenase|nr:dihydrolipoyl dehydrogenase [Candidatus Woesearchaeota archaeon]MDP6739546.1 dihydrolipoyl dehydrogenase [Planctomycetota bacterium]MDP6938445.1 dihydrolipoyl dehydrogenase [Planctomycetota bacterium]